MESVYDMDIRFSLLEAQFNKKIQALENNLLNQIKELEDKNLKLLKANLDLESSFVNRIKGLEELNLNAIKTITNKNFELERKNKENEELHAEHQKLQGELYETIINKIQDIEIMFETKINELNVECKKNDSKTEEIESKLLTQTKQLNTKLSDEIVKVKKYARGFTGGMINTEMEGSCVNFITISDFITDDIYEKFLKHGKSYFNLDCLPSLEDCGFKKFTIKQGMSFRKSGNWLKARDAIYIIQNYGYEIIYEYPDKIIDPTSCGVEYK